MGYHTKFFDYTPERRLKICRLRRAIFSVLVALLA
jgi:hypothetical protein